MMMNWRFLILTSLLALFPIPGYAAAAPGSQGDCSISRLEKREPKEIVRDPRKAAREKKKALREEGVKKVRVKSPSEWPKKVPVPEDTELKALEAQAGVRGYLYESNHYVFLSPVELSEAGQQMIGRLFECTYAADKAVAKVLPVPRADEERGEGNKYKVKLARNMAEYYAAGGRKGSAGIFIHQRRTYPQPRKLQESDIVNDFVLVPFDSLGLDSNGKMVKHDIDTHTLVHEITHQNFALNNLPIWANEGWAEYVGYVPYVGEDLDFERGFSLILHAAKSRAGTDALDFPFALKEFFVMSQEEMYGYMSQGKDTYALSAMLVAFFVHLDGDRGLKAIKAYMGDLIEGVAPEEAAKRLIDPYKGEKKLQKAFQKAWKQKKATITLAEAK